VVTTVRDPAADRDCGTDVAGPQLTRPMRAHHSPPPLACGSRPQGQRTLAPLARPKSLLRRSSCATSSPSGASTSSALPCTIASLASGANATITVDLAAGGTVNTNGSNAPSLTTTATMTYTGTNTVTSAIRFTLARKVHWSL